VTTPHWLQGKGTRINLSQAAFGIILQITGGFIDAYFISVQIAAIGHMKKVTEGCSKLVFSKEPTENFEFDFFISEETKTP
jgi:hypothetical protein